MKIRKIIFLLSIPAAGWSLFSCSDIRFGDSFLGDHPENSGATLDTMFCSAVNADKVLTKAYTFLPYSLPTGDKPYDKMGVNTIEALTDLYQSFRDNPSDGPYNLYYNGTLSANINTSMLQGREAYRFGSELEYSAIRYAWIYVENAHRIPDINYLVRNERIAEAKMIIAIAYAELLRHVGGVPLIDHSIDPSESMYFPRNTFEQTVEFIVRLLDEAAPDLPWFRTSPQENGRMTRAGARALKLRVLLFAASPTFNSDIPWHPDADQYVCYGNYSADRWVRAFNAGKQFFDELASYGRYELVQPTAPTAQERRIAFRKAYFTRSSSEVLVSTRRGFSTKTCTLYPERVRSGPTLEYVSLFPWADGSNFPTDFDWVNPSRQPFFDNGEPTRDPRLYETCVVPGDIYFDGTLAPVYTNHINYSQSTVSGFMQMKFILQTTSEREGEPAHWPYIRLPEVMLSYAEVINEMNGGPTPEAYELVNKVRRRVGLADLPSDLDQMKFREALLRERALEFGFEEVRWFDLVRWGREQDFRKKLHGLRSTGNNPQTPTSFQFEVIDLPVRFWSNNWNTKWYLQPIPIQEINKKYGMTQNPGW